MSLDPHDDDDWIDTEDADDGIWYDDDFPLSAYAMDIVRAACWLVAGLTTARVARYLWQFLRFVVPT